MRFTFTVWTLTHRLPLGILSLDSRTVGSCAGRGVVRFGANHVGCDRGDASDPAVVHITGAQRPDRPWHSRPNVDRARSCRRLAVPACDLGTPRSQPPGNRGTGHSSGAARFFGAGGGSL